MLGACYHVFGPEEIQLPMNHISLSIDHGSPSKTILGELESM